MNSEDIDELLSIDSVLEQTLKDIGIPSRPEIIDRISAEMIKDDPNFRHLGQLIGADLGLSAGLIKTANSPFFGFHSRARSPSDALMMLGLDVASQAIAGISLRNAFAVDKRLESFLQTSAQIAALSGWLTRKLGKGQLRADASYTYGLFRDCGIPVLLKRFPAYESVLARANEDAEQQFTRVERQGLPDFPIDHAMIGCLLAQSWWLPTSICLAIQHHHEREAVEAFGSGLPASSSYLIAVGQLAEHVRQQVTGDGSTHEWSKLGASCLALLDLAEDELPSLCQEAEDILKTVD